jgi:nuclear GTP-binding protein
MVPKKHKSKRQVASKKYKIVKKVNEHHRKQRKEAKLNPTKKLKKDPGVPNLFPFKEKLLQQAKEQSLAQMLMNAQDRGDKFEEEKKESFTADTVFNKDNSKKAFYKEFKKVVQESDVILEILDARDPLGCRTKQIEQEILSSASNKRIILVLNKIGF